SHARGAAVRRAAAESSDSTWGRSVDPTRRTGVAAGRRPVFAPSCPPRRCPLRQPRANPRFRTATSGLASSRTRRAFLSFVDRLSPGRPLPAPAAGTTGNPTTRLSRSAFPGIVGRASRGGRTLDDRGGRRRDGRRAGSPGLGRSQRGAVGGEDVGLAHEGELMEGPRANPVFIGNGQRGSSGPKGRAATATT